VTDGYDNALHKRTTLGTMTPKKALAHLQEEQSRQFDSDLVAILALVHHEAESASVLSENELALHISELQPGMVLAGDVKNIEGTTILAQGTKINQKQLYRLLKHNQMNPIVDRILVQRETPLSSPT
jgi:hypothetical protein